MQREDKCIVVILYLLLFFPPEHLLISQLQALIWEKVVF